MTRILKRLNLTVAIILCILTLSYSLCSMGITVENAGDTQLFAVQFSCVISPASPPSFAPQKKSVVVSWIKRRDISFEENETDKLVSSVENIESASTFVLKNRPLKNNSYNFESNATYYMRI